MEKKSFILSPFSVEPTSRFKSLDRLTRLMLRTIREGLNARSVHYDDVNLGIDVAPFTKETLGGFVTFDKFQEILDTRVE